ncbi:ABC transporter permease [Helcococcus sueciensis]|uniref:ABC transporter permease n=1 Tax=Helcococcus sueciensis TaxID=241555 RepID=UPI000422F2B5|nr:ABC transporter permease [Helcococcus sueciensis]
MEVVKKILKNRVLTNTIIIGILFVIFSLMNNYFLTYGNLRNIIFQSGITIITAFAMTFIILTGGIDLSMGAVVALSTIVGVLSMNKGAPLIVGILVTISVSTLFGLVHGLFVAKTDLNPFIITLSTMNVARGASYIITNGATIPFSNNAYLSIFNGSFLGIPFPTYLVGLLLAITMFILSKTKIGREIYAVGSNKQAAEFSGINLSKVYIFTYLIAGVLVGIGSLLVIGRVSSGIPSYGVGLELDAIVAVVLGGATMSGGRGTVLGTIIGSLVVVVLLNGLTILGISNYIQMIIKGIIILIAVYWDSLDLD